MSLLGESRYGVLPAPGGLSVVQELLNTVASDRFGLPDLLASTDNAVEWLGQLQPIDAPVGTVSAADLRSLTQLRGAIGAAVSGSAPIPIDAHVRLSLTATGRVVASPPERPAEWLCATAMLELFSAQRSSEVERLKICANPDCAVAFFDRSRNRSGVWHDVHLCGNAINLRASRSRRRAENA